jgi:hypothetical protein
MVTFDPDGEGIDFELLEDPEDMAVTQEELRRRLDAPDVGEELGPSLLAARGIIARLLANAQLPDDVTYTLTLIDQSIRYAMIVDVVAGQKDVVKSEYRRKVLSMQRILAGDAPIGKGGIRVTDGVFQAVVVRLLESRHADFDAASSEQRLNVVEDVARQIFLLAGRAPSVGITSEALAIAGLKGRPYGTRNGLPTGRGKDQVYNELLREIGLASASVDGLKKQRKRSGKGGTRRGPP